MQRISTAGALLVGIVAVSGCADDQTTEPVAERVADQVHTAVAQDLGLDPTAMTTRCPADATPEPGVSFDCTIDLDGQQLTAAVTFTDATRVAYRLDGQVIRRDDLEAKVRTLLAAPDRLGEEVVELTCGERTLLVIRSTETVRCQGTAQSGVSGFAAVGLDASGDPEIRALTNQ